MKIHLNSKDVRETVVKILNACDISTNYVDKIPRRSSHTNDRWIKTLCLPYFTIILWKFTISILKIILYCRRKDLTKAYEEYNSEFQKATEMKRKVDEKKAIDNIM